tara:strand:+ start:98 stop:514 length:417 start_codon:yes stop_codon:yes gene_type:complete
MKIIGFNLTRIHAEREEDDKPNVQVNQNIDIKSITEEDVPIASGNALKLRFSLMLIYSDDFANIELEGNVIMLPEEDEAKKLLEGWKTKTIPAEMRIPLFNFIMNKCNIKALHLEDEMNLPLHVPMPRLAPEPKKKEN